MDLVFYQLAALLIVCVCVRVSQKYGFGHGRVSVINSCRAPCCQSYYSYLISSVQQPLLSLPQLVPAHGPGVLLARCSINYWMTLARLRVIMGRTVGARRISTRPKPSNGSVCALMNNACLALMVFANIH